MKPARMRSAALALLGAAACTPTPFGDRRYVDGVERCDYELVVAAARPLALDVTAECRGPGVAGLASSMRDTALGLRSLTSDQGSLTRRGGRFELPRRTPRASFRYSVDLDAIAASTASFDVALRNGGALIAPASTFLLHPVPLDVGIPVSVRIQAPSGFGVASGLQRSAGVFTLQAHEIPVATYTVFGDFERRELPLLGGATLELVIVGALELETDAIADWVRARAEAVARFYGVFPAERALVAVVPSGERSGVEFGKVLPESAPGIALIVGKQVRAEELARDWILVHELFHVGVPSFHREGKWFDEGLATYFEPIVRARAGLLDERALWTEFARELPSGLDALQRHGLEKSRGYQGLYWGGALFCLLADVTVRRQTGGRLGLEDGLRRVRDAGGHASEVWPLARALRTADERFDAPVLAPLAARYARSPAPVELAGLLEDLGVVRDGSGAISLRDDAPLAWVRRAIVRGGVSDQPAGLRISTPVSPSNNR